jgi:hypothetical protein
MNKEFLLESIEKRLKSSNKYDPKSLMLKGSKKDKRFEISFFKVDVIKILESTTPITFKVRDCFLDINETNDLAQLFIDGNSWSEPIDPEQMSKIVFQALPKLYENCFISQSYGTFGCCSRYKLCSDEGKCIHPNRLIAEGCSYKSKLDRGIVYY